MLRLEHQSGFDFHREPFLKMLGNTKEPIAIERIMDVIRNLKDDSVPEAQNIFTIHSEPVTKKGIWRR